MFRQYRKIENNEFVLCGVDTAAGMGDYTTAQFLSKNKVDVPLVYHSKNTTSDFIPQLDKVLVKIFDKTGIKPVVALERNNGGAFLVDRLAGINYQNKYEIFKMPTFGNVNESEPTKLGWTTSTATRPKMLQELKEVVDHRTLGIYDRDTINEMYSFILSVSSSSIKAQAEKGAHDDLVMALAIAWQMYQMCEEPVSDSFYETAINELPDDTKKFKDGFY